VGMDSQPGLFFVFRKNFTKRKIILLAVIVFTPIIISIIRFYTYKEPVRPVEIVVVQPNIDPWKEKYSTMPQAEQDKKIRLLPVHRWTLPPVM
jgi:hypothetical protein